MPDWISHFRKWQKILGISRNAWLRTLPVTYIKWHFTLIKVWIWSWTLQVTTTKLFRSTNVLHLWSSQHFTWPYLDSAGRLFELNILSFWKTQFILQSNEKFLQNNSVSDAEKWSIYYLLYENIKAPNQQWNNSIDLSCSSVIYYIIT